MKCVLLYSLDSPSCEVCLFDPGFRGFNREFTRGTAEVRASWIRVAFATIISTLIQIILGGSAIGAATTRRVFATPLATLLGGWAPQLSDVSPRLRQLPCLGAGRRNHSVSLHDSASNLAQGLGAMTLGSNEFSLTNDWENVATWVLRQLGNSNRQTRLLY